MRLFFALPLPADVQADLAALRCDLGRARWVPEHQLHLTLRFVGELDPAGLATLLEEVAASRERVPWPAVRIAIRGVGIFGTPARPRVLWAAVDPIDAVSVVAGALEEAVQRAGLPAEERPFAPHVTLARFKHADPEAVAELLRDRRGFETRAFDVPEVLLRQSRLGSDGAQHETVRRFALPAWED